MIRLKPLNCYRMRCRIPLFLLVLLFNILLTSCEKYPCPPDPVVVTPEDKGPFTETKILQGSGFSKSALVENSPSTVLGPSLIAGAQGPTEQQSLLDFDYSSLPAGATINEAYLTLYADTSNSYSGNLVHGHFISGGSNAWILRRVLANWEESTVTWSTLPASDAVNQLLLPESIDSSDVYRMDVTTLVKDQLQNPSSRHGFLLLLQDTNLAYCYTMFCSTRHQYSQLRPKLELKYTYTLP